MDAEEIRCLLEEKQLPAVVVAAMIVANAVYDLSENVRRIAEGELAPGGLEALAMSIDGRERDGRLSLAGAVNEVAAALQGVARELPSR